MEEEGTGRREAEAAYRRGWVQGADETARLVLQLVEMGYSPTQIRRFLAAYNDHKLMPWRQEGDLCEQEAAPDFDLEVIQGIAKGKGYDWIV